MRRCPVSIRRWVPPLGPARSFLHFQRAAPVRFACRRPWLLPGKNGGTRLFATSTTTTTTPLSSHGESTIYALSTAPGRAAIAVVRISGPACVQVCVTLEINELAQPAIRSVPDRSGLGSWQIYRALCPRAPLPQPRVAALRTLYDPTQEPSRNTVLDAGALVLYFPSPRTVTGENVLELHVHGGPAIVKAVLGAIAKCDTADQPVRYAEPGEFTRRAFMNERLDLPQIEALGETLAADTEQQRRLAVRGTGDALSKRYEQWRQQLLYARGELEALIDFAEDQHFDESPQEFIDSVGSQVRALRRQIDLHIQNASKGELLRNGIKVALLGAPNAGKSSLLNRIVGKEAAIVSTEEGTTRDIVDVGVDLGGWYCKLGDMAGLRSASGTVTVGAVEQEGIRRAKARALESDVVVVVLSVEQTADGAGTRLAVEPEVVEAVRSCQERGKCIVVAINKLDQLPKNEQDEAAQAPRRLVEHVSTLFGGLPEDRIYAISCKDAQDESAAASAADPGRIQAFLRGLIATFEEIAAPERIEGENNANDISYWEDSLGVTHRQRSNLQRCLEHLDDFLSETHTHTEPNKLNQQPETPSNAAHEEEEEEIYLNNTRDNMETDVDIVTAAEHLRFAADSLAKITGTAESDVEDVLGVVFEKYANAPCEKVMMLTSCVETGSVLASELETSTRTMAPSFCNAPASPPAEGDYSSSSWMSLYPPRPCISRQERMDW